MLLFQNKNYCGFAPGGLGGVGAKVSSKQAFSCLLGRAMVLDSFQCQGILLLWHMVGQGPAVLAAGAGWVGCFFFFLFCFFHIMFFHIIYPIFLF